MLSQAARRRTARMLSRRHARFDRLGHRRRERADRPEPLYRAARRAVRPRARRADARRRRPDRCARRRCWSIPIAWSGGAGDGVRTATPSGRRPGRASAPATARSIMSARPAPAPMRCCSTPARPAAAGAAGGATLLDQYGAADVADPDGAASTAQCPAGRSIGHFAARHGPDNRIDRQLHAARRQVPMRCRAARRGRAADRRDLSGTRCERACCSPIRRSPIAPPVDADADRPMPTDATIDAAIAERRSAVRRQRGAITVQVDTPDAAVGRRDRSGAARRCPACDRRRRPASRSAAFR